jgi:hypothetical protein
VISNHIEYSNRIKKYLTEGGGLQYQRPDMVRRPSATDPALLRQPAEADKNVGTSDGKGTQNDLDAQKLFNDIEEYIEHAINKYGEFGRDGEFNGDYNDVSRQFLDKVLRWHGRGGKGLYGYVKNRGESGFVKDVHEYLKIKTGKGLWNEKSMPKHSSRIRNLPRLRRSGRRMML